jgi:uncharacterized protein YbjT (DUF2867 family)/uncharacterized membrane protein YphA (DoxX/SURF4 family)
VRVLVTGANGFLGSRLVCALRDAGHEPVLAVRNTASVRGAAAVTCDMAHDTDPEVWEARLEGIDAVVNCAGILRETRTDTFQSVHVDAPLALFRACAKCGVRRVIQISALGDPSDGEFIASKHRCDDELAALDLDWLVLRPGLVYSAHGAYGGTALLRAMAAQPGLLLLPNDGMQQLQPLAAEDLAQLVLAALARPNVRGIVLQAVGPQVLTLRAYVCAWRAWFGLRQARAITLPQGLVDVIVAIGEWWGRGPVSRVIANLLKRHRIGDEDAVQSLKVTLGIVPRKLEQALRERPMQWSDLLEARWYVLRPALLFVLAFLWIASAVVGLVTAPNIARAQLPDLPAPLVRPLAIATSTLDLALGALLAFGVRVRMVLTFMLLMVVGYTLVITVLAPSHWLDPFGGVLKNVLIATVLGALLILEPRR